MARGGSNLGGILPIVLVGAGGYFLYEWWMKRPKTATTTTGTTPATSAPSQLDAIAAKVMAAAGTGAMFTADGWNFYVQRELPLGKTAPAPETFIGSTPRESTMSFAQYWGAVAPLLRSDLGLSGLGIFAGLGMVRR